MAGMVTSRLAFLTLPVATVSLALAACGGGGSDPSAASEGDQRAERRAAAVDFAQCMREHGIDMKDPTAEGGIMLSAGPDSGNTEAELETAQKACQKHLDKIKPPELSEEQEAEFKERALAFARCMREHGVDMPDPTFGDGGRVQMRMRGEGVDPENPRFREAQEACQEDGGGPMFGGGEAR
jgi:hypothetical protein